VNFFPIAAVSGLFLLGGAGVAQAADPVTVFGYNLNASMQVQTAPTYEGGKQYSLFPGGSLAISRPWEFDSYSAADDAASLALINTRRFSFGAAFSLRENRGNDGNLEGMRNIGYALQSGAFMNVWPTRWLRLHIEGLKGLTSESGLVVNTGADVVHEGRMWMFAAGPRFSWADAHFNGTYFGVTPGEAQASPYIAQPYTARGGPHYAGVEANAEYKFRPAWRLTFAVGYTRLLADDAGSPLVKQLGTPDQLSGSVGLRFKLGRF
jgi:outer membrane protein